MVSASGAPLPIAGTVTIKFDDLTATKWTVVVVRGLSAAAIIGLPTVVILSRFPVYTVQEKDAGHDVFGLVLGPDGRARCDVVGEQARDGCAE